MMAMMLIGTGRAWSALTDYVFTSTTGTGYDMSGMTQVFASGADDAASTLFTLPFTFVLDGTSYTQFSFNSNGLVRLGGAVVTTSRFNEDLPAGTAVTNQPMIAAFWDDHVVTPANSGYKTIGSAPNRVLVIEWNVKRYLFPNSHADQVTVQLRLYESSNRIEWWFGPATPITVPFDASIGVFLSNANYGVVDGSGTMHFNSGNRIVGPPAAGTMYVFECYKVNIAGDVSQGGTAAMNNGDDILVDALVDIGGSRIYTPFTMSSSACSGATFTYTIGGPFAADYQITPTAVTVGSGGSSRPEIRFSPQGGGVRNATLTVSDGRGFTRTYDLMGRASSIMITGNISQGGLAVMSEGATLMREIMVKRGLTGTFTPLTATNINTVIGAPAVTVTYSIMGISGGQYSVAPSSVSLGSSQVSTPVITFRPTGIGPVADTLIVTTSEGITRKFELLAISAAPAVEFRVVNGPAIDSSTALFANMYACVGTEVTSIPIDAVNIGIGPVVISRVDVYLTDTLFKQGTPPYALRRDGLGNPIPMADYFITTEPVSPGTRPSGPFDPITVQSGTTQRLYLNFISSMPMKRYGRMYIVTDGVNYNNVGLGEAVVPGMLRVDLFARGYGSSLSDNPGGGLPKAIVFSEVAIGETAEMSFPIVNSGLCTLRVSLDKMQLVSGDVDEFAIVRRPSRNVDPVTKDLLLAPGEQDEVVISFTPRQLGSRRARLRLATNDSTIQIPGITERGSYYLDIFGRGLADLYADGIDFGQVLVNAPSEKGVGVVRVRNTTNTPLTIDDLAIQGSAEFTEDPARPWPTPPYVLMPGEELELGVLFAPIGDVGERSATLHVSTTTNIEVDVPLTGIGGTRMMQVNPQVINFPMTTMGKFQRRTIMIKNTGTMPIRLEMPEVTGPDAASFQIGKLERMELAPEQTEQLEITYTPQSPNTTISTALVIGGNATNAPLNVTLNASSKTKDPNTDNPNIAVTGGNTGNGVIENGVNTGDDMSLSGVGTESVASGMTLRQSVPNPAREVAEISYLLARGGQVELALYDGAGRLVRLLDSGMRGTGEQVVRVDLSSLAAGVYHYRLTANGQSLSRTMNVVK